MTRKQFERAQRLHMARQAELQTLAQGALTADPRYVDDVVSWVWRKVLERKRKTLGSQNDVTEKRRIETLLGLYRWPEDFSYSGA